MKPYVFAIQYINSDNPEVVVDRGIMFGESYSDIVKDLELRKVTSGAAIIDIYVVAIEKEVIHLSEESYEKLLDGDIL